MSDRLQTQAATGLIKSLLMASNIAFWVILNHLIYLYVTKIQITLEKSQNFFFYKFWNILTHKTPQFQ